MSRIRNVYDMKIRPHPGAAEAPFGAAATACSSCCCASSTRTGADHALQQLEQAPVREPCCHHFIINFIGFFAA